MHSNCILHFSAVVKGFPHYKGKYYSGTHLLSDVFVGFWDIHCKGSSSGEVPQVAHNTKVCNIFLLLSVNSSKHA